MRFTQRTLNLLTAVFLLAFSAHVWAVVTMPCHFSALLQTDCDETASMMQDMPMHHDHHSPQQTDTTMAHCCEHASLCSATLYPELTLVIALEPQPILTPITASWSAILPASLGNTVFRPPISS